MGMLTFHVPNTLPVEEAKTRVEALLSYWQRKYGVQAVWSGTSATLTGKAMGFSFDGSVEVLAAKIAGNASDPGMLLRGQAQKYLTRKFAEYLNPAQALAAIIAKED
jgi:hypothetical protein